MKDKKLIYPIVLLILGLTLVIPAFFGKVDEFWNGMGSALLIVGSLRLLRTIRLHKNEAYREKTETFETDERFHFIRTKAWSWAGYLFIICTGLSVIVFKLLGNDLLSQASSWGVCLMLMLYWGSYFVLKKKY